MKIVAFNKRESGSKYHRVYIYLTQLGRNADIHFIEGGTVKEEDVKDCDVLFIHWLQKTPLVDIAIWQQKYGFKIIQDIDDYWEVPATHHMRDYMKVNKDRIIDQLILADYIFVSTEFLYEKVLEYNKNVFLRKNYLPVGYGQFNYENNVAQFPIKIGFCGSISHYPDWKSIKSQYNKIINDPFITDKVRFYICGYSDGNKITKSKWDEIVSMLTYKQKGISIKPEIVRSLPTDSYMNLYNNLDIVIAPLEINDFNRAKSGLKLQESAIKNAIVMSNELYKEKDEFMYIDTSKTSYYTEIKNLLNIEQLNIKKKMISEFNLLLNKKYSELYNPREMFKKIGIYDL